MNNYEITDVNGRVHRMQGSDMRAVLQVYDVVYQLPEAVKVKKVKAKK